MQLIGENRLSAYPIIASLLGSSPAGASLFASSEFLLLFIALGRPLISGSQAVECALWYFKPLRFLYRLPHVWHW